MNTKLLERVIVIAAGMLVIGSMSALAQSSASALAICDQTRGLQLPSRQLVQ